MLDKKHINWWLGDEVISPEAQSMLDNYALLGTSLTGVEKKFMIDFVDDEVISGNHYIKDYQIIFSLAGVNALVDYIGGKVATAVNAPTQDINGFGFDGATNYIDTDWNPNDDAVNYALNDCGAGAFMKTYVSGNSPWGIRDTVTPSSLFLFNGFVGRINSPGGGNTTVGNFSNNNLLILTKEAVGVSHIYDDGIDLGIGGANASVFPNGNIFVGGENVNGVLGNAVECTISAYVVIKAVGFDQADYNTNLRVLLTGLGLVL